MHSREAFLSAIFVVFCAVPIANAASAVTVQSESLKPWSVPSEVNVEHKEITFSSKGARLRGTLYFASSAQHRPAVVVLHGASSPSSNLPLYRHLEEILPPLGINVFVFDRRGSGASEGGGEDSYNFDILADDGIAAATALGSDEHVDRNHIGYWGISQGGWLALLAASKDAKAAFAIAVSAPLTTPDVQMNFAVANILRIHGYSNAVIGQAIGARTSVDDYLRGKVDRAIAQKALDRVRHASWFPLIYMGDELEQPRDSSWLRQMLFDPVVLLDQVKAPTLLIYGQADPWIPVSLSMARLKPIAAEHPNLEVQVVEEADHTMMLGVDPKDQVDPKFFPTEAPNSPEYFALLGAWFAHHGFAVLDKASDSSSGSLPAQPKTRREYPRR